MGVVAVAVAVGVRSRTGHTATYPGEYRIRERCITESDWEPFPEAGEFVAPCSDVEYH
ncbi:hypothetical protein [Kitasatospora sp. NPDC057015]|uniref:hypothetical protein n=1 Tax=Kitasatospora sp. NPDC057015 TaxID=3346001 RepID=UPI00363DFCC6